MISDEGDNDVFFDSLECLSPSKEDSLLTKQDLGYELWLNEPISVKERKQRFLQEMGLVDASSQKEIVCCEERIMDCSGTVSNGCILSDAVHVSEKLVDPKDNDDDDKELSCSSQDLRHREAETLEESNVIGNGKKKKKKWWNKVLNRGKVRSKSGNVGTRKTLQINVRHNKKSWNEFSAVYTGQEIRAHKGLIWTMKFSPNGQYLATGGEDGVVRIWCVSSLKASSICFAKEDTDISKLKHDMSFSPKKCSSKTPAVLPRKILKIEESPLQELYGHSSDVMDLAWSDSDVSLLNFNTIVPQLCYKLYFLFATYIQMKTELVYLLQMLLSSSMDKTVRMWKIGCNQCLKVFHHNDYGKYKITFFYLLMYLQHMLTSFS